jgi:hypothetical protein
MRDNASYNKDNKKWLVWQKSIIGQKKIKHNALSSRYSTSLTNSFLHFFLHAVSIFSMVPCNSYCPLARHSTTQHQAEQAQCESSIAP